MQTSPTEIILRDYQREAVDEIFGSFEDNPCVVAPTGCHAKGTKILMAYGSTKKVENIIPGDLIMGDDGTPRTVLTLHHGTDEMFKITPVKGEPFIVNKGHILSLISTNEGKSWGSTGEEIVNLSVEEYLSKCEYFKHTHKLYRGKVEHFKREVDTFNIPPYVLGLFLGDGDLTRRINYTNPDVETYKDIYSWAVSIGYVVRLSFNSSGCPCLCFSRNEHAKDKEKKNDIRDYFEWLSLYSRTSGEKFIPFNYMTASRESRLELLAGLIDTDGSLSNGTYDYVTKSEQLAEDITFVCRSLGFSCYLTECTKKCQTGFSGTYWRLCISGELSDIPCRVARKKAEKRQQKKRVNVTGFKVESIGIGEYYGFTCDGNHLYMMGDFTVTHNSGKSVLIATYLKEACSYFPSFSFLLLTHQKELVEQDVDKLLKIAPELDIGIYSASLKRKELGHRITFASIQSLYAERENPDIHFDVILVDECHLINNEDEGRYQEFFSHFPKAQIIGFTATPFRMGQGRLVEDGHIFTSYINTVGILDLQKMGYLSRLTTKATLNKIDAEDADIKVVAGDYAKGELDALVNRYETNQAIAEEVKKKCIAYNRYHVIIFCTSVNHARNIADLLNAMDFSCVCVEGSMDKKERENQIETFTSGTARAITNCSLLTTGFDYPAIDCVVLIRPTRSTGLYLQMVGRGIRISPETGKENCLLLDFGGNVEFHGPIGKPRINVRKSKKGNGLSPVRVCPRCLEVMERSVYICPSCGYEFPVKASSTEKTRYLFYGDPNGDEDELSKRKTFRCKSWSWFKSESRNGNEMWTITYYCETGDIDKDNTIQVKQYLVVDENISDWLKKRNLEKLDYICQKVKGIKFADYLAPDGELLMQALVNDLASAKPPLFVITAPQKKNPQYTEVIGLISQEEFTEMALENREERKAIEKQQKEILNEQVEYTD